MVLPIQYGTVKKSKGSGLSNALLEVLLYRQALLKLSVTGKHGGGFELWIKTNGDCYFS